MGCSVLNFTKNGLCNVLVVFCCVSLSPIPRIPDPDAEKPDDWDEDAPQKIPDPDAEKPDDWLDDGPEYIPDPEASMPEDWWALSLSLSLSLFLSLSLAHTCVWHSV